MKQSLMQPALWLCVSMISYPDYWCFNKDTTFLHNSTILPHTEKRETALEPFPFQLICFISSEVSFHHLLPGLVSDGDIGFQGIDNTKRVFPQFCGPQFCGSMVALPGGRDLAFPAKQPHIGAAYGQQERPSPCTKGRYRPMAHRNHSLSAQNRHLGAAVWRRCW